MGKKTTRKFKTALGPTFDRLLRFHWGARCLAGFGLWFYQGFFACSKRASNIAAGRSFLKLVGSLALYTPERPSFTFTQRVARQKMLEGPCRIILSCAISGTVGGKATTQISWHGKFCVLPELYSLVIDLIHLQDKSAPKLSDEQVVECPFLGNLEIERPVDTSCVHIVTEWICFTSPPIVFLTRLRCISLHEDLWDCDRKQVYRSTDRCSSMPLCPESIVGCPWSRHKDGLVFKKVRNRK